MTRRTLGAELLTKDGSAYDFTIDGQRFRGATGTPDRKLAAAYALKRHGEEYRRLRLGEAVAGEIALTDAFARFHAEVGKGTAYGDGAQRDHMRALVHSLPPGSRLSDLTDVAVAAAVQAIRADGRKGPATINRHLSTLQAVCRRAREQWGIAVGPWKTTMHTLKEPDAKETHLDYEEAKRLICNLAPHAQGPVLLALYTGLRKSNVLNLTWSETSLSVSRLVVRQKGGRQLSVPLVPAAIGIIQRQQSERRNSSFVFTYRYRDRSEQFCCSHCAKKSNDEKPIQNIRTALATAARKAGLGHLKLRFHDLRHTFASWMLAEGGDLKVVQEALGHTQIKTTMRYAHLQPGARERVTRAVADAFEAPAQRKDVA